MWGCGGVGDHPAPLPPLPTVLPAHSAPAAASSGLGTGEGGLEFRKPGSQPQDHHPGLAGGGRGHLPPEAEKEAEEGVFPVVGGMLGLADSEGLMLAYL